MKPMWGRPLSPALSGVEGAVRRAQRGLLAFVSLLLLVSCSPRDFLTRRLATDLISASDTFKATQKYVLQTGVISNKDYVSPEYLVLQHHAWISATTAPCSAGLTPPPCWDVILTPSGVDTVRSIVPEDQSGKSSVAIPVARRQFLEITGISKQGSAADVEFTWKWIPLNEIGAALYSADMRYKSTVGFRDYDDGWRVVQSPPHPAQTLDDALKNTEPVP